MTERMSDERLEELCRYPFLLTTDCELLHALQDERVALSRYEALGTPEYFAALEREGRRIVDGHEIGKETTALFSASVRSGFAGLRKVIDAAEEARTR